VHFVEKHFHEAGHFRGDALPPSHVYMPLLIDVPILPTIQLQSELKNCYPLIVTILDFEQNNECIWFKNEEYFFVFLFVITHNLSVKLATILDTEGDLW